MGNGTFKLMKTMDIYILYSAGTYVTKKGNGSISVPKAILLFKSTHQGLIEEDPTCENFSAPLTSFLKMAAKCLVWPPQLFFYGRKIRNSFSDQGIFITWQLKKKNFCHPWGSQ